MFALFMLDLMRETSISLNMTQDLSMWDMSKKSVDLVDNATQKIQRFILELNAAFSEILQSNNVVSYKKLLNKIDFLCKDKPALFSEYCSQPYLEHLTRLGIYQKWDLLNILLPYLSNKSLKWSALDFKKLELIRIKTANWQQQQDTDELKKSHNLSELITWMEKIGNRVSSPDIFPEKPVDNMQDPEYRQTRKSTQELALEFQMAFDKVIKGEDSFHYRNCLRQIYAIKTTNFFPVYFSDLFLRQLITSAIHQRWDLLSLLIDFLPSRTFLIWSEWDLCKVQYIKEQTEYWQVHNITRVDQIIQLIKKHAADLPENELKEELSNKLQLVIKSVWENQLRKIDPDKIFSTQEIQYGNTIKLLQQTAQLVLALKQAINIKTQANAVDLYKNYVKEFFGNKQSEVFQALIQCAKQWVTQQAKTWVKIQPVEADQSNPILQTWLGQVQQQRLTLQVTSEKKGLGNIKCENRRASV